MAGHQECCQVEQIHEHFVAVTKEKENLLLSIGLMSSQKHNGALVTNYTTLKDKR